MSDFVAIAKTISVLTFSISEFQIPPGGVEAGLCGRILLVRRGGLYNYKYLYYLMKRKRLFAGTPLAFKNLFARG